MCNLIVEKDGQEEDNVNQNFESNEISLGALLDERASLATTSTRTSPNSVLLRSTTKSPSSSGGKRTRSESETPREKKRKSRLSTQRVKERYSKDFLHRLRTKAMEIVLVSDGLRFPSSLNSPEAHMQLLLEAARHCNCSEAEYTRLSRDLAADPCFESDR